MIESLELTNVGPAPHMRMDLAPRLNLITGDNGLGKSFLLDVVWWALTRRWPHDVNARISSGFAAQPIDVRQPATIAFSHRAGQGTVRRTVSRYAPREQAWVNRALSPLDPGLVVYVLADGGFAVWDSRRNQWSSTGDDDMPDRIPAYVFAPGDVWDGLSIPVKGRTTTVCNGLLRDWALWLLERGDDARRMADVLRVLSEALGEPGIEPGQTFVRMSLDDARDIPTIRTPYGPDVPILHASQGIRRVTALAYMLTWAWREHLIASRQVGEDPARSVVLLIDEIEAHLHPRWQRTIVPSLLQVAQTLTGDSDVSVQILGTTHSPLVLASIEPHFDEARDRLFGLVLEHGTVELRHVPWAKQGDAVNWLVSESFGLRQGRSIDAERAIEAAEAWMRGDPANVPEDLRSADALDRELRRVLAGHDPFWPRWVVSTEKAGSLP